ncbi:MAG: hypothetical protein ACM3XO_22240, partial [Bacteroidota bacterium]
LTGQGIEGPRWVQEIYDFMSLPLMVRPNTVLPVGSHVDRPDYDYSNGVTLQVYQLENGKQASVEIPDPNGEIAATFVIRRDQDVIDIQRNGESNAWDVLLVGIDSIKEINKMETEILNGSILIKVQRGTNELKIHLN